MASHALALYTASCSTYDLEGVLASTDLMPESSYVREEARLITKVPLAIMAPPSYAISGGSSLKIMACSKVPLGVTKEKKAAPTRRTTDAISLKRKAPKASRSSKRSFVTPSGNTVSCASTSMHTARLSLSYTMVGMCKLDGGYGKVLMCKPTKKLVNKPTPLGKESESSGAPLRIKRFRKLPSIKRSVGQYEGSDEEDAPSKGSSITSLSSENDSL